MARRKVSLYPSSSTPINIGNFQVVEARDFTSGSHQNGLQISLSKTAKIRISVVEETKEHDDSIGIGSNENSTCGYYFVLANPNDSDEHTKSLLQEVLNLYMKELPAMSYASNTGKESMFLERCLTNGKYCTLILKSQEDRQCGEVIGAITYQIVPADAQCAEIPLAAVTSSSQHKGIGHMIYLELKKRLQSVGIRTLFCWGDKESEGFWLKQGFKMIGEVNKKGRARKLHIKASIRKALCFPGDSTLMASYLLNEASYKPVDILNLPLATKLPKLNFPNKETGHIEESDEASEGGDLLTRSQCSESEKASLSGCQKVGLLSAKDVANASGLVEGGSETNMWNCPCSVPATKKRTWEASYTSLKSKKVKGTHSNNSQMGSEYPVWTSDGRIINCSDKNCLPNSGNNYSSDIYLKIPGSHSRYGISGKCTAANTIHEDYSTRDIPSAAKCFRIMLMDIADAKKKTNLTKVIEDLGGVVTSDGSISTHVVTGKVRATLNFCAALSSGSWVISPAWLRESFKKGKFVDEMPLILDDEDYRTKYKTELNYAVLRAKTSPSSLFKGLDIWLATHVQPPARTLSDIVKYAGGNVIWTESEIKNTSTTVFVACEEDMEEAALAVKLGIWTFSVDWLMNCIMRQELDLDAPQFAESL